MKITRILIVISVSFHILFITGCFGNKNNPQISTSNVTPSPSPTPSPVTSVQTPVYTPVNNGYGPNGTSIVSTGTPVAISTATEGANIYYTLDGTSPSTANGTLYTFPVSINRTTTLKAIAVKSGLNTSTISSTTYTVYVSPYNIAPVFTATKLGNDFTQRDALPVSNIQTDQWYDQSSSYYAKNPGRLTWGPTLIQYPAVTNPTLDQQSIRWKKQRIVYVAQRYINTQYQHHYLIQWNPPQTWPMDTANPVVLGHQSQGIDCSDFTSWNYSYGMGIKMNSDVSEQAALTEVEDAYEGRIKIEKYYKKKTFLETVSQFEIGDLLYIAPQEGETVTHVITWIGQVNGAGEYLVIDSHDQFNITDSNNQVVPTGVQIRPFKENQWYFQGFTNANRIFHP